MSTFKYTLDSNGYPIKYGYGNFENELDGTEPFCLFDIKYYKWDLDNEEWVYLPDVTDVNTEIVEVKYDWQSEKTYITIADPYQPGPHEFDCTEEWTTEECEAAIAGKFSIE